MVARRRSILKRDWLRRFFNALRVGFDRVQPLQDIAQRRLIAARPRQIQRIAQQRPAAGAIAGVIMREPEAIAAGQVVGAVIVREALPESGARLLEAALAVIKQAQLELRFGVGCVVGTESSQKPSARANSPILR